MSGSITKVKKNLQNLSARAFPCVLVSHTLLIALSRQERCVCCTATFAQLHRLFRKTKLSIFFFSPQSQKEILVRNAHFSVSVTHTQSVYRARKQPTTTKRSHLRFFPPVRLVGSGLSAVVGACPLAEARAHVAHSHSCSCVPHGEGGPWNILACVALIVGCPPCCKGCATLCRSAGHGRETRTG